MIYDSGGRYCCFTFGRLDLALYGMAKSSSQFSDYFNFMVTHLSILRIVYFSFAIRLSWIYFLI